MGNSRLQKWRRAGLIGLQVKQVKFGGVVVGVCSCGDGAALSVRVGQTLETGILQAVDTGTAGYSAKGQPNPQGNGVPDGDGGA